MALMVPSVSDRNFTPTSTAAVSASVGADGTVELAQIVQGQVPAAEAAGIDSAVTRRPATSATAAVTAIDARTAPFACRLLIRVLPLTIRGRVPRHRSS